MQETLWTIPVILLLNLPSCDDSCLLLLNLKHKFQKNQWGDLRKDYNMIKRVVMFVLTDLCFYLKCHHVGNFKIIVRTLLNSLLFLQASGVLLFIVLTRDQQVTVVSTLQMWNKKIHQISLSKKIKFSTGCLNIYRHRRDFFRCLFRR